MFRAAVNAIGAGARGLLSALAGAGAARGLRAVKFRFCGA